MKRPGALLALAVLASACHGDDAYLGGGHAPYRCGSRCWEEQGAPSHPGDWFFNPQATLGAAPSIVYPLAGSVHPKDLGQLTVQFRRGREDFAVFRVRFEAGAGGVAYDFFTPCLAVDGDGCRFLLKGDVWDAARAELVDAPLLLSVTGSTAPNGVMLGSEPLPLSLLTTPLKDKGFYYWTRASQYSGLGEAQQTGIFRLPFGADRAEPFIMPETKTNERQCGACHSVSRDGSTIAFTARNNDASADQRSGVLVVEPTASPDMPIIRPLPDATYDSSMMALTSDGRRVLVASADGLTLKSSSPDPFSSFEPGAAIVTLGREQLLGKLAYFPEFSAHDEAVVVTLSDQPDSAIAVQSGDIARIPFDALSATFGAPEILVPGTEQEFHFYPTWSPDGGYVAFASAPRELDESGNPRKSYDQKQARLRLVSTSTREVTELLAATQGAGNWSTFPKFAPFDQGGVVFLTFNSKIDYGLLLPNSRASSDAARLPQLWMSALDLGQPPAGDPSSPPIWLPFQDVTQPSHLGFWTEDVKCRDDIGDRLACEDGQICSPDTHTCQVVVK